MSNTVPIRINGRDVWVPDGVSIAAAIFLAGETTLRTSISGEPRAALCGMGICFECRVTVDGRPNCRSCQLPVRQHIEIQTG